MGWSQHISTCSLCNYQTPLQTHTHTQLQWKQSWETINRTHAIKQSQACYKPCNKKLGQIVKQQNIQYQIGIRQIRFYHSRPQSTSMPLQQLLRSPWAAPGFAPVPSTERRQGATTLRTQRLTLPGDRHRQSDWNRGSDWWGSYCAAMHPPMPAGSKM